MSTILLDNTVLKNKWYLWSGTAKGLYLDTIWKYNLCKVTVKANDIIYVYDILDNKEYMFTREHIQTNNIKFSKIFKFF